MPAIRRSKKKLSPRRIKTLKALARKIDTEDSAAIRAQAREVFNRHQWLRRVVDDLKAQRQNRGLSLTDLARLTGIAKPNLSRLENSVHSTPTLDTLERYARAVGMTVRVELVDATAA
ncbi:MAG TPA: helix-turn-helix transcriptional regulator [Tepidisphaeraceae bacterium]|jgi:DNA-binding Xre family transcriptional regulator|nr:helix-turn-helix transcriptional regulator [Tepidisphaeraceae bacterium]